MTFKSHKVFRLTVYAQLSQIMKVFYHRLAYTSILHYLDQINCKNQEVFQKGCNGTYKVKEGNNIDNSRLKPKRIKEHWGVTQVERINFLPKTIKCSFSSHIPSFFYSFIFLSFFSFFFVFLFLFFFVPSISYQHTNSPTLKSLQAKELLQ